MTPAAAQGIPHDGSGDAHRNVVSRSGSFDVPALRRWIVVPVLITGLVFAAGMVLRNDMFLSTSDLGIVQDVGKHHSVIGDALALTIHDGLAGWSAGLFLLVVGLIIVILTRSTVDALLVGVLTTGGWASTLAMRFAVGRARPDPGLLSDPLVPATAGLTSFPSGPTAFAVSFGIAVSLVSLGTHWQGLVIAAAAVFAFTAGASQVYLGVHYPSDVIASYALSVAAAVFLTGLLSRYGRCLRSRETHGAPALVQTAGHSGGPDGSPGAAGTLRGQGRR
ncbi:undecaprenyl-diphosphatase [Arthrobacter sp. CAN_A6]|uniref:phosphatase PAP2 family protein n=1 Tax=Arthrobacter sp. CAN_A6 TaxID=2787721 RepID=UPI0018C9178B